MVGLGWDPGGRASDRHNPGAVSESIQRYCALQLRSVRITTRRLIPLVLDAASGKRLYVTVIGTDYPTPDGTAVRDYVHVCDLARTHVLALEYLLDEGDTIAVNLGTGRGASVRQVVDMVRRITGRDVVAHDASRRAGDPPALVADPKKAVKC